MAASSPVMLIKVHKHSHQKWFTLDETSQRNRVIFVYDSSIRERGWVKQFYETGSTCGFASIYHLNSYQLFRLEKFAFFIFFAKKSWVQSQVQNSCMKSVAKRIFPFLLITITVCECLKMSSSYETQSTKQSHETTVMISNLHRHLFCNESQ